MWLYSQIVTIGLVMWNVYTDYLTCFFLPSNKLYTNPKKKRTTSVHVYKWNKGLTDLLASILAHNEELSRKLDELDLILLQCNTHTINDPVLRYNYNYYMAMLLLTKYYNLIGQ